jgi:hypothetical protein
MKDSTRPPESKLLELRNAGDGPLAYSYLYSEHRYAFAGSDILPHVSDKPFEVIGLEDTLQDSRVNMLVLGSGTTPEVLYLKDLLPNATVLYVIPGRSTDAIVSLERSLRARWWARELGILKRDITVRGESAWPADLTGFSTSIEDNVRFRFHEVTPQMVLALICGEQIPGFNIVSNRPGLSFLRSASDGLNGVFRRSGNFPKIFV